MRVRHRQFHGAHHIPKDTIVRRYARSIENFLREYQHLADHWAIYDNTMTGFTELIASRDKAGLIVQNDESWKRLTEEYLHD